MQVACPEIWWKGEKICVSLRIMKKIVVGIDFSDATLPILKMAGEMGRAFSAAVLVVHVIEPEPTYSAYGFTADELPAMREFQAEARARAERALTNRMTELGEKVLGTTHLLDGHPLHSLLDFAKEENADLVIVGSHGHGAVASLLLGSVADGLVHRSDLPSLIVPVRN